MITDKMAHVIMGALTLCNAEGVTYVARDVFPKAEEIWEAEEAVVKMLYDLHPEVVKHERYRGLESVQKVLKNAPDNNDRATS